MVAALLQDNRLLVHPFVIGEVALGHLKPRREILAQFLDLPYAIHALDEDVMEFIEGEKLFGLGIGYVDAHLLASVRLTPGSQLWTRDKRVKEVARKLGMAAGLN